MKTIAVRRARFDDVGALRLLIERSVRGLQSGDYTPTEINQALAAVYGVDTQLIRDGTYYAAEVTGGHPAVALSDGASAVVVGCGGWSKRRTLFGGDHFAGREDALLDPARNAAKIRAFFVDPQWARHGIGSALLEACERAALGAGFTRLEMGATLTGVPFYTARGYTEAGRLTTPLPNGGSLAIVRMEKRIGPRS